MDKEQYLTPAASAEAELIEKRSRFLARVGPAATEAEAQTHIERARRQYPDANHHVYAYILRRDNIVRCSDDGEPSGTSGPPALAVFQRENIVDVCCVITRFFGGTLLGTGGLARAYAGAARLGLEAAGLMAMRRWAVLRLPCPYPLFERLKNLIAACDGLIESSEFGANIMIEALVPQERSEEFLAKTRDLSAGAIEPKVSETVFRGVRVR